MIEIVELSKEYGNTLVLDNINLSLPRYGLVVIYGPSGCGKTTLLNCLAGLIPFDGSIKVNATSIETLTDNQLITLHAIYCCGQQNFNLPIDIKDKRKKYLTACVLTMDDLNLSYDKKVNRTECLCFLNNGWRWMNRNLSLALEILK